MAIYTGVDGVRRKVTSVYAGVNGARKTVSRGFNGINGVRRQFFGPFEGLLRIELRISYITVHSVDSSGNITETLGGTLDTLNKYGSVTISDTFFQVQCNTVGKRIQVYGYAYAIFDNREAELTALTERYGASVSFPVTYNIVFGHTSSNWNVNGQYHCLCCGVIKDGYVDGGASGVTTLTGIEGYQVSLLSSLLGGYGGIYQYVNIGVAGGITLEGVKYPVKIVNNLR